LERHLEGEHDKLDNVSNVEPWNIGKIKLHKWDMEHCEEPHHYPQGTMKHHKGHELFKELNQNKAQELKKEGPPLN
jgi:hypothetical protein